MSEWQPIETQPDQGEYLIFMPKSQDSVMMVCRASKGMNSILRTAGGLFMFDHDCKPTHWMPLPAPPSDFQPIGDVVGRIVARVEGDGK